ncbi:MAG: hypothetical protein WB802_04290, partial [Candidatus Dormiibacterota bacterium]
MRRAFLRAVIPLLIVASARISVVSAQDGGGASSSECQTAAGLTILQPSSGSLTAAGDLTLYCPGTGTDGRNGETGQGTPATVQS